MIHIEYLLFSTFQSECTECPENKPQASSLVQIVTKDNFQSSQTHVYLMYD